MDIEGGSGLSVLPKILQHPVSGACRKESPAPRITKDFRELGRRETVKVALRTNHDALDNNAVIISSACRTFLISTSLTAAA